MPSTKYKILIVEDHRTLVQAYEQAIGKEPDLEVCGIATNINEFIEFIENCQPNIVLMDIYLPDDTDSTVNYDPINQKGLSEGLKLKKHNPEIGVLFTSALVSEATVRIILNSSHQGGLGFIQKGADFDELLFAIRQVAQGKKHVDFQTNRTLLTPKPSFELKLREILSSRETEVIVAIAEGLSRNQVANRLGITAGMVDKNLENIRRKFAEHGVNIGGSKEYSMVHLAHFAIAVKLVSVLPIEVDKEFNSRI